MKTTIAMLIIVSLVVLPAIEASGQGNGFLKKDGQVLFPIGFYVYKLPSISDAELKVIAKSGFNLIQCSNRTDLDRVAAVGMLGWMPLDAHEGATDKLREKVEAVKNHPALAIWEGLDEIVHNFTAWSGLHRIKGVHKTPGEWWKQTPEAVEYSNKEAEQILPKLREGIQLVRSLDARKRQFWINEASTSDLKFVRRYIESVDITGCDTYPISGKSLSVGGPKSRNAVSVGGPTERWKQVGRGKPVWMVLQAFSWSELKYYNVETEAYPSFKESRLMAYDVIVHGAKGILYWGFHFPEKHVLRHGKNQAFRESIYALASELAALQPFLVVPEQKQTPVTAMPISQQGPENKSEKGLHLRVIEQRSQPKDKGVKMTVRKVGDEWLIILVNEDNRAHMGVEITGLDELDGRTLELLYGSESDTVQKGEFITRMMPYQVKVFATSRKWETNRCIGRNYQE